MAQASHSRAANQASPVTKVQIELDETVLARLFADGHLCAAQISCLNLKSKQAIWQLCLTACAACIDTLAAPSAARASWESLPRLNQRAKTTCSDV